MGPLEKKIREDKSVILRERGQDSENFSELLRFIYEVKKRSERQALVIISFLLSLFTSFFAICFILGFPHEYEPEAESVKKALFIIGLTILLYKPYQKIVQKKADKREFLEEVYLEQLEAQRFLYAPWRYWNCRNEGGYSQVIVDDPEARVRYYEEKRRKKEQERRDGERTL